MSILPMPWTKHSDFRGRLLMLVCETHWENHEKICKIMQDYQRHSNKLKTEISQNLIEIIKQDEDRDNNVKN